MDTETGRDRIKTDIEKEDDELISQIAQKTGVSKAAVLHKMLNMAVTPKGEKDKATDRLEKLKQIMKATQQSAPEGSDDFLNKMLNIESIRAVKGDSKSSSNEDSAMMKDMMKMGMQMKMMQYMMPREEAPKSTMMDNLLLLKMIGGDDNGNSKSNAALDKLIEIEQRRQEMTAKDSDRRFEELKDMFFKKEVEDKERKSEDKLKALEERFVEKMQDLQYTIQNMTPQEKKGLSSELREVTQTMGALTEFMKGQGYVKDGPVVSKEGNVNASQLLSKGIGALEKIGTAFAQRPVPPPRGAAPAVHEMEMPPEQQQPMMTPNEQMMYEQQLHAEQVQQAGMMAQPPPDIEAPASSDAIGLPGQNNKTEDE